MFGGVIDTLISPLLAHHFSFDKGADRILVLIEEITSNNVDILHCLGRLIVKNYATCICEGLIMRPLDASIQLPSEHRLHTGIRAPAHGNDLNIVRVNARSDRISRKIVVIFPQRTAADHRFRAASGSPQSGFAPRIRFSSLLLYPPLLRGPGCPHPLQPKPYWFRPSPPKPGRSQTWKRLFRQNDIRLSGETDFREEKIGHRIDDHQFLSVSANGSKFHLILAKFFDGLTPTG